MMDQDPDAGLGSQGAQPHLEPQRPHHIGDSGVPFTHPDAYNHSSHAEFSNTTSNTTNHDTPGDENAPSRDVDADAFYKSYQPQSTSPSVMTSANSSLPMATSVSQPTIRSNRDVGSVKRPVPPEQRSPPRTNLRSVSGPVGGRPAGAPSVKDLMKRFDQNDASAPPSRVPVRSVTSSHARRDPVTPLKNRGENGSLTPARLRPSGSSPDVSSPKSFANRINNPRRLTSESVTSIKRTNATHVQGDVQTQPRSRDGPSSQGLLFGEILPDQGDASVVGYGIRPQRGRRTSESSVHDFARPRSFSDPDMEPSSPAHWYRNAEASQEAVDETQHATPRRKHNRSQSDASSAQFHSPQPHTTNSLSKTPTPGKALSPSPSSSKLPVPVRRLNSPTGSESSHQSRPNSPPSRRQTHHNGSFSRTSPPNSRAKTPTSRAKTPTHSSTRERRPPHPSLPSSSSGRVPAYVSVPPPSQSPTQRGSRPRQSVTMASTASSRMRESTKHQARGTDSQGRRRKISVGPIDFEQRREHIRLAYSKSIRESQVLEARQKAAQDEPVPSLPSLPSGEIADSHQPATSLSEKSSQNESAKAANTPSLTISTSQAAESASSASQVLKDSPTLGLPGSFPEATPPLLQEEIPQSAVSTGSASTEFDNEPQTTPAVPGQHYSPLDVPRTVIEPPSPQVSQAPYRKSEYKYPFADEASMIKEETQAKHNAANSMSEATSYQGWSSAAPSVTNDDFEESFNRPPPQPENYETTVTILPPQESTQKMPTQLVPSVPFPRMLQQDESDYCSELDNGLESSQNRYHGSEYATTDACTEDTDERDRVERHYGEEYASRRASTCASSDVGVLQDHAYDQPFATASASGLGIPRYSQQAKRSSHQSAWTDYSVETPDGALGTDSPFARSQHQLPEVDTGEGFSVPYLSPRRARVPSHLPSPDHEPPPIPPSAPGSTYNSRPSSAYYDQSYNSTLLNSERESDDYASYNDTPRSVETPSFEAGEQDSLERNSADADGKSLIADGDEPTGKERHRLVQRRNVIKELVDTEAVFVRDMNIVEEIYKGTAEACPKLDDQTVKIVFRNSHEIIEFHTTFLAELKVAVAGVYVPKGGRTAKAKQAFTTAENDIPQDELSDIKDRETAIGEVFQRNIDKMKTVHENFLRNSDQAAKRLIQIQQDSTVKVWLTECNEVAKDLTAAWDLDSLLIKPMQRITKYPNIIITMLQHTPQDHPDREELVKAKDILETAIIEINKTKKNFELVGQIVGRKRKESDVKGGLARAFGKRVDKLQTSGARPIDDAAYTKLKEKFGDDYLRLQVVLRDVEFYTRQVSEYVHEFLQYLSSIELVMRLQPGSYPELESKWVQFNISMRDLEKVVLEDHLAQVRKQVIEPFEQVIKAYGNPSLAMKKRQKRRADFEKAEQLRRGGKSLDPKLRELVEQYDALNDALLKELPKLSTLTERVGNICLGNFVNIQANWYRIWKEKMKTVLIDCPEMPEPQDIVSAFQQDHPYAAEQLANIGILNPASRGRPSQSATNSIDEGHRYMRSRTADPDRRGRGLSMNHDAASGSDLTPRNSDSISMTPSYNASLTAAGSSGNAPSPHQYYYRDYYSGIQQYAGSSASPKSSEVGAASSKSLAGTGHTSTRPSTSRSYDSGGIRRQSSESSRYKRDSNTYSANQLSQDTSRFSNLFHSALPLNDGPNESQRSSRASSRDRGQEGDGYNVLWLAASLFEFNITTTKHEAGYPYLTYQAGEIFDVIAEKGELWLAKNQDDLTQKVGWIWSKHFARLADS